MRWRTFALAVSFGVLLSRWGTPLASAHAFRETQTAITVYWLMHGGPIWFPWTPVLGPPWTIPLEFPLFQYLVVPFAYLLPLDFAGRVLSWLFMVATLWPLGRICQFWQLDEDRVGAIYLLSPFMLYWGTCFLMETCAIFFGVMFLWMVLDGRNVLAVAAGACSSIVKGTAFVPIAVASMSWLSLPCLGIGLLWQKWTDFQKPLTQLNGVINSALPAQRLHNYGDLSDRLHILPVIQRALEGGLGIGAIPLLVLFLFHWKYRATHPKWELALAFLVPFLIFPRLFTAHEYYSVEVVIPLVLLIGTLVYTTPSYLAIVIGQLLLFITLFLPILRADSLVPKLGKDIQAHTSPDAIMLIYGQGWSSQVPYYAQRRAIMESDLSTVDEMASRAPTYHPDVILRCPDQNDGNLKYEAIFDRWPQLPKPPAGGCVLLYLHH